MEKYSITYSKTKYLTYFVEAENLQEAIKKADDTEEKFGTIGETPYVLAAHNICNYDPECEFIS